MIWEVTNNVDEAVSSVQGPVDATEPPDACLMLPCRLRFLHLQSLLKKLWPGDPRHLPFSSLSSPW